jgi:carbon storage regulator
MVIYTRRIGQSITIGNDVKVVVLRTAGKQVRFGVAAPKQVIVHRQEVYERLKKGESLPIALTGGRRERQAS